MGLAQIWRISGFVKSNTFWSVVKFLRPNTGDLKKKRSLSKFQVFFRPKTGDLFLGFENMAQRQFSATLSLFQYWWLKFALGYNSANLPPE